MFFPCSKFFSTFSHSDSLSSKTEALLQEAWEKIVGGAINDETRQQELLSKMAGIIKQQLLAADQNISWTEMSQFLKNITTLATGLLNVSKSEDDDESLSLVQAMIPTEDEMAEFLTEMNQLEAFDVAVNLPKLTILDSGCLLTTTTTSADKKGYVPPYVLFGLFLARLIRVQLQGNEPHQSRVDKDELGQTENYIETFNEVVVVQEQEEEICQKQIKFGKYLANFLAHCLRSVSIVKRQSSNYPHLATKKCISEDDWLNSTLQDLQNGLDPATKKAILANLFNRSKNSGLGWSRTLGEFLKCADEYNLDLEVMWPDALKRDEWTQGTLNTIQVNFQLYFETRSMCHH